MTYLHKAGGTLGASASCALITALALTMSACGSADQAPLAVHGDERITDKTWQVVGIYTAPQARSAIPDSMVDVPTLVFGQDSLLGTTGCQRFRADVTYNAAPSTPIDRITEVSIDAITFDTDASLSDCTGDRLWAHNSLTRLYSVGNAFDVYVNKNDELSLTLQDDLVDSPAVKFISP
ncbi:MAG: hypothetical protein SOW59_01140 [Corynebacterium sp.]|nr:hypothetical protein [Corynebacterium sp.]